MFCNINSHHNWVVGTLPTPKWINISFENIDLKVKTLGQFVGLPESPIDGLFFKNVSFRLPDSVQQVATTTNQCNCTADDGFDVGGVAIKQMTLAPAGDCCDACVANPRCLAYVYDLSGEYPRTCYLKASLQDKRTNKSGSLGAVCRGAGPEPKPPRKKYGTWNCGACFGKLYASGSAESLSPPFTGNCVLQPATRAHDQIGQGTVADPAPLRRPLFGGGQRQQG